MGEIVEMNRRILELSGGGVFEERCQNFQNRDSLEHVLESLDSSVFGFEQYPSIAEKAAALCWVIITRHVFKNGNKRTGLLACHEFLTLNGCTISFEKEDAEQMVLKVGREKSGERSDDERFAEIVSWIQQKIAVAPAPAERGRIAVDSGFVCYIPGPPSDNA